MRSFQHIAQTPSWRTTPCRLSATAYSIYSLLPSILEDVPTSATQGRAKPWWQGPCVLHVILYYYYYYYYYYTSDVAVVKKGKVHPIICREGPEGITKYSSTLFLTLALNGVVAQCHAPAVLYLGKTQYPIYRRLGGPQVRFARARKISPPPALYPRTFHTGASLYTDLTLLAHSQGTIVSGL